ncbi:MAG: RHS repeat-associated core domain-containing protein, partial [Blastocatellia bacterium]
LYSISYNPAEKTTGFTLGNGVVETLSYDANTLQMTGVQATNGSTTLMNLSYGFSAAAGTMGTGTIGGATGQLVSVSGTVNGQTESAAYTYDLNRRITSATQTSNGQSAGRGYTWDVFGNRLTETDTIAQAQIQSFTMQQAGGVTTNRIASVNINGTNYSYSYDSNGNILADGTGNTYTYDAENRLVSVSGSVSIQNSYDFQNRRIINTESGNTTHYVWQGNQVLAEMNGTNGAASIDYVLFGAGFIAKIQASGAVSYLLSDGRNERLRVDSSGLVQGVMGTLPFGEDFAESGSQENHHFTTYDRDPLVGLDYAVNRHYGSITGRFLSTDPDGASGRAENPQSWNRYAYAGNDPVNNSDALGLDGSTDNVGYWFNQVFSVLFAAMAGAFDFGPHGELQGTDSGNDNNSQHGAKPTCGMGILGFAGLLDDDELATAQAVFAESSSVATVAGQTDMVAIAFVILNRTWYLNVPGLTDTHGFGPKGATTRQVLGARDPTVQFPEFDASGNLQGGAKKRYDDALASDPSSAECLQMYASYATVYGISLGQLQDPNQSVGGSWYFGQHDYTSPGQECRDCSAGIPLPGTRHYFYTFPYQNYTGGTKSPYE